MSRPQQQHRNSDIHDSYFPRTYSSNYQSYTQDSPPSRLSRPSYKSHGTSASFVSTRSTLSTPNATTPASIAPLSRTNSSLGKRARPMSPCAHVTPSYAISPYTPSATSTGWSHINAANGAGSPPPMGNARYVLRGGMDTPSIQAEKRYSEVQGMDFGIDGRMGRDWGLHRSRTDELLDVSGMVGGERNGRGRGEDQDRTLDEKRGQMGNTEQNTWGGLFLGAIGTVVAGAFAFCRKAAFQGFHAGGGQGYNLPRPQNDSFASENMWEDEQETATPAHQSFLSNSTRSYDRLPTPVPGEYPQDSPPEDNVRGREDERPPAKRRQTDSGGWIVVDRREARSRTGSPRLSTPVAHRVSHQRARSGSNKRQILTASSRNRKRLSSATATGSPQVPVARKAGSLQTSPSEVQKISPPSVEVKKYAARRRKAERANEERYDRVNERLKEMIKQGKEALGSKVEVVEGDDVW